MNDSVLVTGANSDIGQETIKLLLVSNMNVIAQVRNKHSLEYFQTQYPDGIQIIESELENQQDIEFLWSQAKNISTSPIKRIIYTAAISSPLPTNSPSDWWQLWQQTMSVNAIAPAYLMELAASDFRANESIGTFIMLTSRAIHQGDDREKMHYAASKAALANIIKTAAKDFKNYPIHLYNIAPGFVQTKRIEETILPYKGDQWIEDTFPLGSLVNPKEIAELILFLLTKPLGYMTGATFDVNGATYLR